MKHHSNWMCELCGERHTNESAEECRLELRAQLDEALKEIAELTPRAQCAEELAEELDRARKEVQRVSAIGLNKISNQCLALIVSTRGAMRTTSEKYDKTGPQGD